MIRILPGLIYLMLAAKNRYMTTPEIISAAKDVLLGIAAVMTATAIGTIEEQIRPHLRRS